jgi:hypothetical protein
MTVEKKTFNKHKCCPIILDEITSLFIGHIDGCYARVLLGTALKIERKK